MKIAHRGTDLKQNNIFNINKKYFSNNYNIIHSSQIRGNELRH